ncbi:MAG: ATP-binding protein, partial [Deltaproteobacteria bacterium]|nr:ATP-binding protein [Deltaproteobacteria bacterium]
GGNDSGKSNILQAIGYLATPPVKELTCQFSPQYRQGEAFTIDSTFSEITDSERLQAPHYNELPDGKDFDSLRLQLKLGGSYEVYYGSQKISGSLIPDWSSWLPSVQNIHCGQVSLLEDSVSLSDFQRNPSKHPTFRNLLKLGGVSETYSFIGLNRIDLLRMLDMVNRNISGLRGV